MLLALRRRVETSLRSAARDPSDSASAMRDVRLHVPVSTILKVLIASACVWALLRLVPSLIVLFVALVLAITLWPLVDRLERRGLSRSLSVGLIACAMIAVVALFVFLVLPPLATQTIELATNLGAYRRNVQARLNPNHPLLAKLMAEIFDLPSSPEVAHSLKRPLAWGQVVLEASLAAVLVLVLSLYLLLDGKRTYAWLLAYVPRRHRQKMAETVPAVSDVVMAYVQGQLITSLLYGIFAFVVLTVLHVPSALPLAVLAAICDVLPILGVFVSTIPAAFFALTVSPVAAAAVVVLYLLYHALENYVIVPRVYGRRLRLSPLVVIIALIVGGSLYGVLGAVLILPLFAAYPIIEKIWLADYLSDEVVADHAELAEAAATGEDRAIDAVLQGEEHASERTTIRKNG
jgi:predicted PurR-regulated permease PerM